MYTAVIMMLYRARSRNFSKVSVKNRECRVLRHVVCTGGAFLSWDLNTSTPAGVKKAPDVHRTQHQHLDPDEQTVRGEIQC